MDTRNWLQPKAHPLNPGDHVRVVLKNGDHMTGLAGDFPSEILFYQMIQPDPFVDRDNMEQPPGSRVSPKEVLITGTPPPSPAPGRYRVKVTAIDTWMLSTSSWIETYRWRWWAKVNAWIYRVPQGGQFRITAELLD